MPGYTKADFDAQYSIRAEREWGHPNTRQEVRLHYHRKVMQPIIKARWETIVPLLGITSADVVVVCGCGFGWGTEILQSLTGCTAVGIDISDYVAAEKGNDEAAEIAACIAEAGLDPTTGEGLELYKKLYTPEPRAKTMVLKEDGMTAPSRTNILTALNGTMPTWIITEDMINEFTDAEIGAWVTEANLTGVPVAHFISTKTHTPAQLKLLTGHTVVADGKKI